MDDIKMMITWISPYGIFWLDDNYYYPRVLKDETDVGWMVLE